MNKTSKNEKGFTAVEAVLIFMVVVLIGVVGWLVYKDHHKTPVATTNASTSKSSSTITSSSSSYNTSTLPTGSAASLSSPATYTYPGGYFTLSYPSNWTNSPFNTPPAAAQPGILANGTAISPPNADQGETIGVTVFQSTSLNDALSEDFVGNGTTVENNQSLTIGGYKAMYQQNVVPNSTTDDSYAITNGTYTVVLDFRVLSQGANVPDTNFNAANLLPQFNAVVESLKF